MTTDFVEACKGTNLNYIKECFYDKSNITEEEYDLGFEKACCKGNFEIVSWLYNFRPNHIKINYNSAFSCASYYGNFNIVKYLYIKKVINIDDHTTLFSLAIKNKNLEFVKWVLLLKNEDIKEYVNDVCYYGTLEILKYLYSINPDILKNKDEAIMNAELVGNDEIIKWIRSI
jgi:ankyrin repeat protein